MSLKLEKYYDIQFSVCGFHRSTDFNQGMETKAERIRASAKKEGWTVDKKTGENICPKCKQKKGCASL